MSSSFEWNFGEKHLKTLTWWLPDSPVKDRFGIILDGAVRSGKTLPGSCSFVLWAFHTFPRGGGEFFIAGKTIHTIVRNVIRPMMNVQGSLGIRITYKRAENLVIIEDQNKARHNFTLYGGHDEASQDLIQGFTAWGGFLDEAPLMPQSFVDMAMTRLSVEHATAWFTCNPSNPAHWFKTEYIDKAKAKGFLHLHMTMDDNLSLPESVKKRYKTMFTGVFYRRYILGEWCAAEGLVYPEFASREDLVFDFDGDYSKYSELIVGQDYGTQNANVFILFGFNAKEWRWEQIKEWYHSGRESENQMTDAEYYAALVEFVGDLPVQMIIIDPSAASFITLVRKSKRFRVTKGVNDVLPGIAYTASLLHVGKLVIERQCVHTIREMASYTWDDKAATRGDEKPLKVNDHCPDAIRYVAFTHIRRYEKRYGIQIYQEAM